jgi:eukaryotic-like serine/threonine-protein kinase
MTLVGKKVGSYEVTRKIGQGGMASVYEAYQPSLGRKVAIKQLRQDYNGDPMLIERFEREALSIASLHHQNIVHIYDFIKRSKSLSIVMEHVDGLDLYDVLKKAGHLPSDVAAIIALKAARALEHAHFHGVIHRDFKPSNLMLTKSGDIKLMDFGIARDEACDDLTLPGQALGTPAYMSPEQVLGEDVDFRADLFSFGIVLYQMLTGQKPFIHNETRALMQRIVSNDYVPPRSVAPLIPRELQNMIKICLQKNPADRYSTTTQLRTALEKFVNNNLQVNPNERLVLYLEHRGLLGDGEAAQYLTTPELSLGSFVKQDQGEANAWETVLKPITYVSASLFLFLTVAKILMVLWFEPVGHIRLLEFEPTGIIVDGTHRGTTPLSRPLSLSPGEHLIELKSKTQAHRYKLQIIENEMHDIRPSPPEVK